MRGKGVWGRAAGGSEEGALMQADCSRQTATRNGCRKCSTTLAWQMPISVWDVTLRAPLRPSSHPICQSLVAVGLVTFEKDVVAFACHSISSQADVTDAGNLEVSACGKGNGGHQAHQTHRAHWPCRVTSAYDQRQMCCRAPGYQWLMPSHL